MHLQNFAGAFFLDKNTVRLLQLNKEFSARYVLQEDPFMKRKMIACLAVILLLCVTLVPTASTEPQLQGQSGTGAVIAVIAGASEVAAIAVVIVAVRKKKK